MKDFLVKLLEFKLLYGTSSVFFLVWFMELFLKVFLGEVIYLIFHKWRFMLFSMGLLGNIKFLCCLVVILVSMLLTNKGVLAIVAEWLMLWSLLGV